MIELRETPVFTSLDRVAVVFACEVVTDVAQTEPPCGFRLTQIYRDQCGSQDAAKPGDAIDARLEQGRKLFTASRSFLDDITTGPPGVNGRPLFLAAELNPQGGSAIAASIVRPAHWSYEFENTSVQLSLADGPRAIPVDFIDHFCVFESGRIFYLASFGQMPGASPRLDEYALIQLERLTFDPAEAADADYLGFRLDESGAGAQPATLSLHGFLADRLERLCAAKGQAPNAVRDVLKRYGIVPETGELKLAQTDWLRNGLVQIEDATLLETASFADRFFATEEGPGEARRKKPKVPNEIAAADSGWKAGLDHSKPHPHLAAYIDGEDIGREAKQDETEIPRPVLAFAGLAQAVPDFPRQDFSEIHDSTRPASAAPEGMFYVHPAFELAIGVNWRTFGDAQQDIGGCPYAIMAWIIGLHDEVIVTDMERRIERMIYGEPSPGAGAAELGRAEPASDLMRVWRNAASVWRSRSAMIDANLRARLDIFRWCSIHRSGNVFRYPTERELLAAIGQCRGTDARFDDAHATLDRYENLVEDLSSLTANYAAARANWLLGAIAVLGLIGLPTAISGTAELLGLPFDPLWATLAILAIALALFLLWNRVPRRS